MQYNLFKASQFAVADARWVPGTRLLRSKFFHFHAVFSKLFAKCWLAHPYQPPRVAPPSAPWNSESATGLSLELWWKCRYLDALLALDRLGLSDIYDLLVTGILSLSEQHLEMVKLSTSETSSEKWDKWEKWEMEQSYLQIKILCSFLNTKSLVM